MNKQGSRVALVVLALVAGVGRASAGPLNAGNTPLAISQFALVRGGVLATVETTPPIPARPSTILCYIPPRAVTAATAQLRRPPTTKQDWANVAEMLKDIIAQPAQHILERDGTGEATVALICGSSDIAAYWWENPYLAVAGLVCGIYELGTFAKNVIDDSAKRLGQETYARDAAAYEFLNWAAEHGLDGFALVTSLMCAGASGIGAVC